MPRKVASIDEVKAKVRLLPAHRPEDFLGVVLSKRYSAFYSNDGEFDEKLVMQSCDGEERLRSHGLKPSWEHVLYTANDACVAGSSGCVWLKNKRILLADTCRSYFNSCGENVLLRSPRFAKPARLKGLSLSIVTLSGEGFYHFLSEGATRLKLATPFLKYVDHVIVNGTVKTFHSDWMALFGVPNEKLVFATPSTHYVCDQLLFSNFPSEEACPYMEQVESVKSLVGNAERTDGKHRNIWISRMNAGKRHLSWEAKLLQACPTFESVRLETMTAQQQIQLIQSAKIVAGPHGAGLTGVVFSELKPKVIEFYPIGQPYNSVLRRWLSTGCSGFRTIAVDFETLETDHFIKAKGALQTLSE
jgi:hypothetical protein